MCLQSQGIDNDDDGVGRVRRDHRLSNNDGGVRRGQGIHYVYEGSDTTPEAAGDRQLAQGIYNIDGGVSGGICVNSRKMCAVRAELGINTRRHITTVKPL